LPFLYYALLVRSIPVLQKKRGRPATGQDPVTAIRLSAELRASIDTWAAQQEDQPPRSVAIRRLIELALGGRTTKIPRIVASGDASNTTAPAPAKAARSKKARQRRS
jgi:hypothetical protein